MIQLIPSTEYKTMPWKNGLGTTEEIAIYPSTAHFPKDDFDWRLSSARIQNTNEFSNFKGYDRLLVIWRGDGLALNKVPLMPFHPFYFSGETEINCELLGAQILDLGFLYKRDRFSAEMKILHLDDSNSIPIPTLKGLHFLFCAKGTLLVDKFRFSEKQTLKINTVNACVVSATEKSIGILISVSEL